MYVETRQGQLVVFAGFSVGLQQVLNANLRVQINSPWWAGFVSYFVGMVAMLAAAALIPGPRLSLSGLNAPGGSWFAWTGGFFGAIFITIVILTVPRLGAATVLALVVVGQMVGSLMFDHFGLFGVPQHSMSMARLAGAGCLILGVILIRG